MYSWILFRITFRKIRPSRFCAITSNLIPSIRAAISEFRIQNSEFNKTKKFSESCAIPKQPTGTPRSLFRSQYQLCLDLLKWAFGLTKVEKKVTISETYMNG